MATVVWRFVLVITLLIGIHVVHAWTNTKTTATTTKRRYNTASILISSSSCTSTTIRPSKAASVMHHASALLSSASSSSFSSSDEADSSKGGGACNDDDVTQQDKNWLEMWALEGAKKIATLDINERTQRAMLAEICEDEIYQLTIGELPKVNHPFVMIRGCLLDLTENFHPIYPHSFILFKLLVLMGNFRIREAGRRDDW